MSEFDYLRPVTEVLTPYLKRVSQHDRKMIAAVCAARIDLVAKAKAQRANSEVAEQLGPLERKISEQVQQVNRLNRRVQEMQTERDFWRDRAGYWRGEFTREVALFMELGDLLDRAVSRSWRNLWGLLLPRPPKHVGDAMRIRIAEVMAGVYRSRGGNNSCDTMEVPA